MRIVALDSVFREDLEWWIRNDRKTALRLMRIIDETIRDPEGGIGKPERLKYVQADVWSKRLTKVDRVVYRVLDDRIEFLQARFHYRK